MRRSSASRARQLADDFTNALNDLDHPHATERTVARRRAIEALVDVVGLAGANRGEPRDRLPELRLLTWPMCGAWAYVAATQPTPGTFGAAAFVTGTYAVAEGFRYRLLRTERARDDAAWTPTAVAAKIHEQFGRRVLADHPHLPGLADASAAGVFRWAIDLLRIEGREVIDVCDARLGQDR